MRIERFLGMTPKSPHAHLPDGGAQWAENCFLADGTQLIPEREPLLLPDRIYTPQGALFTGTPVTLWRTGDVWVAWPYHVEVCYDYRRFPNVTAFLFVDGGILYRCCDQWILEGSGPRAVGIDRPPVFPEVTVLGAGTGTWSAQPKDIVGEKVSCPTNCQDGAQPGETRSYLFTYVNSMGEESAPSNASEPIRVPIGEACLVADPNQNVPPGVVARRWYRSLVGGETGTWRFVREVPTVPYFSDTLDALMLGDELQVQEHWPPPPGIKGVARLGEDLTLVWDEIGNVYVSAARLPHAFPPANRQRVHARIRRVVSTVPLFEGRTSIFEAGSGFIAYLLTDGMPYAVTVEAANKRSVSVHQYQVDEPLVAPRAATAANGECLYSSPRGVIRLTYGEVQSITDELFTHEQWTKTQPHLTYLAFQRGRLFCLGGPFQWYLPISTYAKDRAPLLSAVSLKPTAVCARPDALTMALPSGVLTRWDGGTSYMRAVWWSKDYHAPEYWNPGAIKVDTVLPFTYTPQADDAWQDYKNWRRIYGACAKDEEFYRQFPDNRQHQAFITYMKSPVEVEIYREGVLHAKKIVLSRKPIRLPRQGRGIYWSVKVKTRLKIVRIIMEKSIRDMSNDVLSE